MESKTGTSLFMSGLKHIRSQAGVHFELIVPELKLRSGQFVAFVGPSGCGKSTLLDILGLVLNPQKIKVFCIAGTDGSIDLAGLSQSNRASIRSHYIGYVLQTGGLLPFLSVRQNIGLPLRLNRRKDRKAVEIMARTLGIEEQLDKLPRFLSGGQRQRAAIARALIHQPKIVLADEPTAAVDELTAMEIRDQFSDLSRTYGTTTIMVTHDRRLIQGRVDRIFNFTVERKTREWTISTLEELEIL